MELKMGKKKNKQQSKTEGEESKTVKKKQSGECIYKS